MKLSEAIRLGAMMKPQAFGGLYGADANDGGSCALGAAEDAAGHPWHVWDAVHPALQLLTKCPACGLTPEIHSLPAVAHLNDEHRWTRERIADWVEQLEARQDTPTPPTEPVAVAAQ